MEVYINSSTVYVIQLNKNKSNGRNYKPRIRVYGINIQGDQEVSPYCIAVYDSVINDIPQFLPLVNSAISYFYISSSIDQQHIIAGRF